MNNLIRLSVVAVTLVLAGAGSARAQETWDQGKLDRFFDGRAAAPEAPAVVVPVHTSKHQHPLPGPSRITGLKKGASEGAMLGFGGVLSPAVSLLSAGFGREMSSYYDGPSGSGHAGLYTAAGWSLAVILYVPALVAGAVGGIVGGLLGAAAPKAAAKWDAEGLLNGDGD